MRTRMMGGALVAVTAVVAALSGPIAANAAPNAEKTIPNSAPGWLSHGKVTGTPSGSAAVQARVYLAPNGGLVALAAAAKAVSTPGSSSYHHFLTPAEFHSRFDAASATIDAVTSWLTGAGLSIAGVEAHGRYLDVTGNVAAASKAFDITMANYSHNGDNVQAPTGDLHAPNAVAGAVLAVSGLDTTPETTAPRSQKPQPPDAGFRNPQTCSHWYGDETAGNTATPDGTPMPQFFNKTLPFSPCGYTGPQLRNAYEQGAASLTNGAGVTVAIVDAYASPTIASDANTYARANNDPQFADGQFSQSLPGSYTRVNSGTHQCTESGWYGEETLDVEAVHAMAPAANVRYYASKSCYDKDFLDTFARINDDEHHASVVSNSWGDTGDAIKPSTGPAYDAAFLQGALEGISYVFSTGDSGDEVTNLGSPQTDFPASDPYVTGVGGTSTAITTAGIIGETGWQTTKYGLSKGAWAVSIPFQYGGGGGYSSNIPEPDYQVAAGIVSPKGRALPDVSMDGDPTTGMLVGQTQTFTGTPAYDTYRIGGTSLAAPLFAGMTAIKVQNSKTGLGLLNELIYTDHSGFNDITGTMPDAGAIRVDFANGIDSSGGYLYSVRSFNTTNTTLTVGTGWDDETGWGSARAGWLAKAP